MNFIVVMFMVFFLFSSASATSFLLDTPTFSAKYMNNFVLKGDAGSPMEGRISLDKIKGSLGGNKQSSGALILTKSVLINPRLDFTFETDFTFLITKTSDSHQNQGQGFAFFLAPNALAYANAGNALSFGLPNDFLAVVFDTSVLPDGSFNNNIKILNNTFQSIAISKFDLELNSGTPYRAWVKYGLDPKDSQNTIWVYVSQNLFTKPSEPVVVTTVDVLQNQQLYFGFSGNSPVTSYENHYLFTWRLKVNITKSKKSIFSKVVFPVLLGLGLIVMIILVGYILLRITNTGSNYYEQLRRSASIRRFLGDDPSTSVQSSQNSNIADPTSSVHGQNTRGSSDGDRTPTSVEVNQPRVYEMVQRRRTEQ